MPVCNVGLARFDRFATGLACQILGRHLAVTVHQHNQGLGPFILHDQSLDHRVLRHPQFARRNLGPAVLLILVGMLPENNPFRLEPRCRWRLGYALLLRHVSTSRMMRGVQQLQAGTRDMGVDLGGGDVRVPQQHLHHAQVGAMVEEVRRKCMS